MTSGNERGPRKSFTLKLYLVELAAAKWRIHFLGSAIQTNSKCDAFSHSGICSWYDYLHFKYTSPPQAVKSPYGWLDKFIYCRWTQHRIPTAFQWEPSEGRFNSFQWFQQPSQWSSYNLDVGFWLTLNALSCMIQDTGNRWKLQPETQEMIQTLIIFDSIFTYVRACSVTGWTLFLCLLFYICHYMTWCEGRMELCLHTNIIDCDTRQASKAARSGWM